jgi:hypothetical protein
MPHDLYWALQLHLAFANRLQNTKRVIEDNSEG